MSYLADEQQGKLCSKRGAPKVRSWMGWIGEAKCEVILKSALSTI